MAEAVHKSGSPVLVDTYAQKTALRLGVSPEAVRAEFKKAPRPYVRAADEAGETPDQEPPAPRPSMPEYWLLKLLFLHESLVEWATQNLDLNWIQHPLVRSVVSKRFEAHRAGTWQNLGSFLDECDQPEMQNVITEAAAEQRAIPNPAQQLADVSRRLRNLFIDHQLQEMIQRANQPETNEGERIDLLRRQKEIRALKLQPLPPPAACRTAGPRRAQVSTCRFWSSPTRIEW